MRVFVLGSGSTGNALLIEACGTRVLVEAGIAPRVLAERLGALGKDLAALGVDAIIPSHEHGDHFGQALKLATALDAPLYLHDGIGVRAEIEAAALPDPVIVRRYAVARPLRIGAMTLTTVRVPHDAAQVAFRIDDGVAAFGIATDVGRVTRDLVALLADCDAALVEANHCSEMLAFSEYPEVVKRRVAGGFGHLSNAQTADLAARLVGSRVGRLWLGHLSRSNNTPHRALEVVATRARRIDVDVLPGTAPVALEVRSARPRQLALPFA